MSAWNSRTPDQGCAARVSNVLTPPSRPVSSLDVTIKTRMAGIRATDKTLARWARKAKAAGMSLNKWACLVLDTAPDVKPATLGKGPISKAPKKEEF